MIGLVSGTGLVGSIAYAVIDPAWSEPANNLILFMILIFTGRSQYKLDEVKRMAEAAAKRAEEATEIARSTLSATEDVQKTAHSVQRRIEAT